MSDDENWKSVEPDPIGMAPATVPFAADPDPVAGQAQAEADGVGLEAARLEIERLSARLDAIVLWAAEIDAADFPPDKECPIHGEYSEAKPCPPDCQWQWILAENFRLTCRPDLPRQP